MLTKNQAIFLSWACYGLLTISVLASALGVLLEYRQGASFGAALGVGNIMWLAAMAVMTRHLSWLREELICSWKTEEEERTRYTEIIHATTRLTEELVRENKELRRRLPG